MRNKEQMAFWAAIRANPLEDTPRLVYADWLQENGDETRAEFIRVQCQLAALGTDKRKGRKERPALEAREKALLAKHDRKWLAPFRSTLKGTNEADRLGFRRGFVNLTHLNLEPAKRIAMAGDDLEPFGPCNVGDCKAAYSHDSVVAIANWNGAGCLTGLSVSGAGNDDVAAIVRSTSLRNLTSLGLWYGNVDDSGITELAAWPPLAALCYVNLKDNPISDAGAFALADSPYFTNVTRLDLYRTQIGPNPHFSPRHFRAS